MPISLSRILTTTSLGTAILSLAFSSVHGQAIQRCDVVGVPKTQGNGNITRTCLDVSRLNGDTLLVPRNATRISEEGLAICKSAVKQGGLADIAYILDQSGSMFANYLWVNPATQDTSFLETLGGCSQIGINDTIGHAQILAEENGSRSVKVLDPNKSLTGCSAYAGDPYGQRGVAFRSAIQYQSELSPSSTAGYLGFNNSVVDAQSLLQLTPANVALLQSQILMHSGGTNYRPPLDSAKRWLNDTSLAHTGKRAIIFLSDGKPYDYYSDLLTDGKMPPIYGIFLGNPSADYSKLKQLSDNTGGQFYLIPPTQPDSLKSVVKAILNIILKTYAPVSATLRNESLVPAQESRSLSSDFIAQGEASWIMRLDQIVALAPNTDNRMSLVTQFEETQSHTVETRTTSFVLRTSNAPASGHPVLGDSLFALSCYDPSRLQWLDAGNRSVTSITEVDSLAKLRLITAPELAASQSSTPHSLDLGDSLAVSLANLRVTGDSGVFQGNFKMKAGATSASANLTLETKAFDTVIATWQHPRDAQDTASVRVSISPANKASSLRFSLTDNGPIATEIPPTQTRVYLVLDDQSSPNGQRQVSVTSSELGIDAETVTLSQTAPGHFQGSFSIKPGIKSQNNGNLEVSPGGDQLRAVYRDPQFGDSAIAQTGFDQAPQEAAKLVFVDGNGNTLVNGALISPANLAGLKLVYSDDFAFGTIGSKTSNLNLISTWNGAATMADSEALNLTLQSPLSDTRGAWSLTLPLFEGGSALRADGQLNFRFLGTLTAQVKTHDNTGQAENATVQATLRLGFPDSSATLSWQNRDTVGLGGNSVEGLTLTVRDQDYSPGGMDSTLLRVLCPTNGDSLTLAIKETKDGTYGPVSVGRNLSVANPSDAWISCPDGHDIIIRHIDPVYGTTVNWTLPQVATPTANPPAKTFLLSQTVSLSTQTAAAQIGFTSNGNAADTNSGKFYTGAITFYKTTTIRARGYRSGYRPSAEMTQSYTKQEVASQITILDASGNPLPGGILYDSAKAITVQVRTSQGGLTEIKPTLKSTVTSDEEEKRLFGLHTETNAYVYQEPLALSFASSKPGNDTLDLAQEDTLIAFWRNPENPSDLASDTVIVRPRYFPPTAYFTNSKTGNRISVYPSNQDTAFVGIEARPNLKSPFAEITATLGGVDHETISLVETTPGHYVGAIRLLPGTTKQNNDGKISPTLAGDQLTVIFIDPIYLDSARGNAGFAQGVEESAQLVFTDSDGNAYAPNASLSPEIGVLHLRFTDDWNAPIASAIAKQTVQIVLRQISNGTVVAIDTETVEITLDSNTSTLGYWKGQIAVDLGGKVKSGDGKLQTAYLGEVVANLASHNNAGNPDGGKAQAKVNLVYPDQPANIQIKDENGELPNRPSKQIQVVLKDGPQPTGGQPLNIRLSCEGSRDSLRLQLIYSTQDSAWKGVATKLEGKTHSSDTTLTCLTEDILHGEYTDPTHGSRQTLTIPWTDPVTGRLYYTHQGDSTAIFTLSTSESNRFEIHAIAQSPSRDRIDTLVVLLTGPGGEKESVKLVETGVFTGHFMASQNFEFTTSTPSSNDGLIQATLDLKKDFPSVQIDGVAGTSEASLILKTKVARLLSASISDRDRDGRADAGRLVFATPSDSIPSAGIHLAWNSQSDANKRDIASKNLQATPSGLQWMADVSDKPWGMGVTSLGSPHPMAQLPAGAPWYGQEVPLEDSVGPIPLKAIKKPSDLTAIDISEFEKRFSPDTLIIEVSEPLVSPSSFKSMLRFSSGCSGWDNSLTVKTYGEPTSNDDKTVWTVLVDNTPKAKLPLTGDCIYLETDGRYTDANRNSPSPVSVKLSGDNPKLAIRLAQGYPPVAGLDAREPAFLLANTDTRSDRTGRFSRETSGSWDVIWIPPVGFSLNDPMKSVIPSSPKAEPSTNSSETGFPSPMPSSISVVQVATTGRYIADISIFDNVGHFIRHSKQAFGYQGEMRNPYRSSDKGMLSFLVWDMKDQFGAQVGQGVFIWKIRFAFADGRNEIRVIRTGVLRP